ncbi:Acg family FMN-binding oxidoreductase [Thermocatellispora tengchongensis]|uniref:Acg family FMN-binding oxidoreductase n=1 Tax=Thermocatellispora tengchongensis TaxID=1073253 RepID=UPI00363959CD
MHADTDRLLRVSDPTARELYVSCGAALYTLRLALRAAGYDPVVRVLPDPDRPALAGTVRLGPQAPADEHTQMLAEEIERRRTHRGGFLHRPLPRPFLHALDGEARAEGARLLTGLPEPAVAAVADVTRAAENVQRADAAYSGELMRWARPPGSDRPDGVPADAYPRDRAEPAFVSRAGHRGEPEFAQRDYSRGRSWGYVPRPGAASPATGAVAAVVTAGDGREDWIAAGRALQRVLLFASAHGVSAAFHTQALEMYHLRDFLRREVFADAYPQMIMRLGVTDEPGATRRRPLDEIFTEPS